MTPFYRRFALGAACGALLLPLAHCKVDVAESGASNDAAPEASGAEADDGRDSGRDEVACGVDGSGQVRDRCRCATSSAARGRECSPTNACPPELDCIYRPGCTEPKGVCLDWARCSDGGDLGPPMCDCDGKLTYDGLKPFAYADAGGPQSTMCGKDAASDAAGD